MSTRKKKKIAEKQMMVDMQITDYGNHVIIDEDSVQALLIAMTIIDELNWLHVKYHISIDDINYAWYVTKYEESDMIMYTLRRGGLLWTPRLQKIIDKVMLALHYDNDDAVGLMRIRAMIWDTAQHIDDLAVDYIYVRMLYQLYSNLLGTYYNDLSAEYWQDKDGDKWD